MKTLRRFSGLLLFAVMTSLLSACGDSSEIEGPLATTILEDVQLIDPNGTTNMGFPMVFDEQGDPHIAYLRSDKRSVIYAHRSGSVWNTETVIQDGDFWNGLTLGLDGSQEPIITYQRMVSLWGYAANFELSERVNGAWSPDTVDTDGWCGSQASIQVLPSGLIRVAYFAGYPYYDLRYAERIASEWTRTTVDSVEDAGYYPALTSNENGDLTILYNTLHVGLRAAVRNNENWSSQTLETGTYTGSGLHLAADSNSGIHIIYASDTSFMYASETRGAWHYESIEPTATVAGGIADGLVVDTRDEPWFVSSWIPSKQAHTLQVGTRHDGRWFTKEFPEAGEIGDATLARSPDGRLGLAYVTMGDSLFFAWIKP